MDVTHYNASRRTRARFAFAERRRGEGSKLHRIRISPADLQKRHLVGLLRSGNRRACRTRCSRVRSQTLPARSARRRRHRNAREPLPPIAERLVAVGRAETRGERKDGARRKGMRERERETGFIIAEYAGSYPRIADNRFPDESTIGSSS